MPGELGAAQIAANGLTPTFWRGRTVLVTGHTGFKGAWLSLWLQALDARVVGFSRGIPSEPSLYAVARVGEGMCESIEGDICDPHAIADAIASIAPEVVIHMAAQPFVRRSYEQPRETFEANVMGTANVLDAVRRCDSVRAVVCVTSDKCYENRDTDRPYREGDPLGGHDPYSASKGAAEIVVSAYRRSFFGDPCSPRVATARAGNVFGGGDWGEDRLIPDIMRCALDGKTLRVRNPAATRPWQHVLCPLGGYLLLARALCESAEVATAWNFGPAEDDARPVGWIVRRASELWPGGLRWSEDEGLHPHEAAQLMLDSSQARKQLGWTPEMSLEDGLAATVEWYRALVEGADMRRVTLAQIAGFGARATPAS
ncbi:MAG: CDP-glucose 4,6-dehydratase [Solirubrobacteraceae bacterium]